MTRAELTKFAKMMLVLAVATRAEIDDPMIELYFRALADVPLALLDQASVELAGTAKFMPKPVEWREAVDELLDRRQRFQALGGPTNQLALPGDVGVFVCADCDNTGFVVADRPCDRGERCGRYRDGTHTHGMAARCSNKYCVERKKQAAERARRYARD